MSVEILYNNKNIFNDESIATPSVEFSSENVVFGKKIGMKEIVILHGLINSDSCDKISTLSSKRDKIIDTFSENFKNLKIIDGSKIIFERKIVEIAKIDFPAANYAGVLNYSIEIDSYDELMYKEFYGVTQPINSIEISRDENGNYTIDQTISADGLNTKNYSGINQNNESSTSNALQNAIDFVQSIESQDINLPEEFNSLNLHSINRVESIDRLKNNFNVQRTFLANKESSNDDLGIFSLIIDEANSFGEIQTANLSGSLQLGMEFNFSDVQEKFKEIDFHQKLIEKTADLNYSDIPQQIQISEVEEVNLIKFRMTFEKNSFRNSCGIGIQSSVDISEKEGGVFEVSVDGEITASGRNESRWAMVKNEFENKPYDSSSYGSWIHQEAQESLNLIFSGVTLNQEPESRQIDEQESNGVISFSYSFTNKEKVQDFKNLNLSCEINDVVDRYSVDMNFGGGMDKYIVTKHGITVGTVSVEASGNYTDKSLTKEQAINKLKEKTDEKFLSIENDLFSSYYSNIETESNSFNENSQYCSFSQSRTYYKGYV